MSVSSGGPSRGYSRPGSFMADLWLVATDGVVGAPPGGRQQPLAELAHGGPGKVARRADRGEGELLMLLAALPVDVVAGEAIQAALLGRRGVARAPEDVLLGRRERL